MADETLSSTLQARFGHTSFRSGQEAIVRSVIEGRDVLAVMPTGSGKSLGYQLPSILLPGVTLVVSPLIALMKDQVDELTRRDIAAAAIHSMLSPAERRDSLERARTGMLRLLYVAPERFASDQFARLLETLPVARFAVDEAHCVSEWGHDFRPDYRRLAEAADRCRRADGRSGRPPVIAFTATATPEVRDDIVTLLGLQQPEIFVTGFDRPNLLMDVCRVSGAKEKRRRLPGLVGDRRALVYAATRKSTDAAAQVLLDAGITAGAYHAGLDDHERTRVQEGFADGRIRVVAATNAFGMGIDRSDIDAVIHLEIPGSLEAYYQEIGRAGRDGRAADVTLLWNYVDVRTREFLIDREHDDDPRQAVVQGDQMAREHKRALDRAKLRRMIAYADSTGCLRATLLRYFGETDVVDPCDRCGNCRRRRPLDEDQRLLLLKILSGVARAGQRFGRRRIVAMLLGDLEDLPDSLTRLSTTGLLRGEEPKRVGDWLDAAIGGGLLRASDDRYRTLTLTPAGQNVLTGRTTEVAITLPELAAPPPPRGSSAGRAGRRAPRERTTPPQDAAATPPDAPPPDEGLLASLKLWRRQEAAQRGVPAYVVLHDRTLAALATVRPTTLDELASVPGIGPAKLETYGSTLLELVARTH